VSVFTWIDGKGRQHELDSPVLIEAEAAALADEMDSYVAILDDPDPRLRDKARAMIVKLQPRLARLRADLARWNDHAVAVARGEVAVLAEQIDRLPAMIANVMLVVNLHGEHDRMIAITGGAPGKLARLLAEPMTAIQRRAIATCASRAAPAQTATREEAKAWLDAQPRFARGSQAGGGWFAWTDRRGDAHRLVDPLPIEREIADVAYELAGLRSALTGTLAIDALYTTIESAVAFWERLSLLKADLERFEREAKAREDTAWTAYAADWRSKRKTT
jgi:hypothetical protein